MLNVVNNKTIISADIHMRLGFLDHCKQVFLDLYTLAKQYECSVTILGDIYHLKAVIRSECQNLLRDILKQYNDVSWTFLVGNHDYESKEYVRHSLEVMKELPNVRIIDEVFCQDSVGYIPYCLPEDFPKKLKNVKDCEYLMCHVDVAAFKMNNFKACEKGVDKKLFKKFKRVFSGHYHNPQTTDNITYVGSPYQNDFGESGQNKRYLLWDKDKDSATEIQTSNFPKFYIVKTTAEHLVNMEAVKKCAFHKQDRIRFDVSGTKDQLVNITKKYLKEKYMIPGPVQLKPIVSQDSKEVTIKDSLNYYEMLSRVIDLKNVELDKTQLYEKGKGYLDACLSV